MMRLRRPGADPRGGEDAASASASAAAALEPTRRELRAVALHQAVPFVGFGIMDNSILILAGEAIDIHLGAALGISTMCAAAVGNIGADLCGVAFGAVFAAWIERMTSGRLKLPPMPQLSHDQRNLRSVKASGQLGCAAGLTLGCVIGMFPLLFFSEDARSDASERGGGGEGRDGERRHYYSGHHAAGGIVTESEELHN
ncbi:hypothetical protein ACHAW5_002430 [Stephanodiscus triporus]|uniref:Transmembrane protein 65 n=1 Tax=Stephanodiscus triporus TaxID=2934178 RepID=A0ABD3NZD6_9STRA